MFFTFLTWSASADCPSIIEYAKGLNMHLVQPIMMFNMINYDCCDPTKNPSIVCNSNRVTRLIWSQLGLNGTINMMHMIEITPVIDLSNNFIYGNISFFPEHLSFLSLENNYLSGPLPSLPLGGVDFNIKNNFFTGQIPNLEYYFQIVNADHNLFTGPPPGFTPATITYSIAYNQLTGSLPEFYDFFWIRKIYLNNNLLSGDLVNPLIAILEVLVLDNNLFSGSIGVLPLELVVFSISNNNLKGLLPAIPSTIKILRIGPGNQLHGTVNLTAPTVLNLQGNYITNLVIKNTSQLTSCTLDNTPLLYLANNYNMCSKNNMYIESPEAYTQFLNPVTFMFTTITTATASTSSSTIATTTSTIAISTTRMIITTSKSTVSPITDKGSMQTSTTRNQNLPTFTHSSTRYITHKSLISTTTLITKSNLSIKRSSTSISIKSIQTSISNINDIFLITITPITIFFILKLLFDSILFVFILYSLIHLKKNRKLKRIYVYTPSTINTLDTVYQNK